MAKCKKEIRMMALHPADHPSQYAEQPEDQIPLNISESNGDSPKFFSAPCSPSHSLSTDEFGTEAVVIDGVVETSQSLNRAGLPEGTGEESVSVACDRDSASTSGSASNLEDIVVEVASYGEEEIPAEESVVSDQYDIVVAEESKQVVEISEESLNEKEKDSSYVRTRLLPLPEDDDSFKACRFSGGAETLPAQVGPCASQMVQCTKWWSCCGLLEAFHRPSR